MGFKDCSFRFTLVYKRKVFQSPIMSLEIIFVKVSRIVLSFTPNKMTASSVYINIQMHCITASGKLLTNSTNKRGNKIDPCGTLKGISRGSESIL